MTAKLELTKKNESGFLILEVLLVIGLLGIFGLCLARATITSLQMRKKTLIHQQANQLAIDKLEEYSQSDASALTAGVNTYESSQMGNLTFDINTSISGQSDGSKTVYVDVTAVSQLYPLTVSLSNSYY